MMAAYLGLHAARPSRGLGAGFLAEGWTGRLLELAFWYLVGLVLSLQAALALGDVRPGAPGVSGRRGSTTMLKEGLLLAGALLALVLGAVAFPWLAQSLPWLSLDADDFVTRGLVPFAFVLGLYSHVGLAWLSLVARARLRQVPQAVWASIRRVLMSSSPTTR
jgi:hypothetical protein